MTTTCILLAWIAVLLLSPVLLLAWATESRRQRIHRWRDQGLTWKVIAARLGVSPSTARRWSLATA